MRRLLFALLLLTLSLLTLSLLIVPMRSAVALPAAPLASDRAVMNESNPIVEKVACWRYGWRGFGVYPGCYRPRAYYRPRVYAGPVVVVPPVRAPHRRCWINGAWRYC